MNRDLIEAVTKMIVEKLQEENGTGGEESVPSKPQAPTVTFWDHTASPKPRGTYRPTTEDSNLNPEEGASQGLIQIRNYSEPQPNLSLGQKEAGGRKEEPRRKKADPLPGIENPKDLDGLRDLMAKTPARIGVGRAGLRPKTDAWLKFRFDHAAAVDAVYGVVNEEVLSLLNLFKVNTMVDDKEVYIRRPDYGRKLSEEAKKIIKEKCKKEPTVQIIVSDGLSSSAVEENVEDVYLSLQQSLNSFGIDMGTPFYIEKGRVAVMDDVGELLRPKVVVLLIGERPGLVSAESLSAYLCYQPRRGTIEADRMVISNIHKGGIPPVEAGAYIGTVVQKILKYEASGVSLVNKES